MSDNDKKFCIMCGKYEDEAGEIIKLPGGINVCSKCMENAMQMADRIAKMDGIPKVPPFTPEADPNATGEENAKDSSKNATDAIKSQGAGNVTLEPEAVVPAESDTANGINDENKEEPKNPDDGDKPKGEPIGSIFGPFGRGISNIGFMNFSDLQNMMLGGGGPKVKKRKEGEEKTPVIDIKDIPLPHKIKEQLDEYVVGQEMAKKVMSVAVYNHYKRVAAEDMKDDRFESDLAGVEIEKSNMLLIGPTGCGKTYLVKTLAKLLNVPLAIADATSLTEAGYIGDDIESVVSKLLAAADNDVDRAECGIIFIDEIDKIAKKKNAHSRDVSGESVQQGMLKLLEGAEVEVPVGANSKNAMVPLTKIDTKNILFICGGAFPDLDEIIKQRLRKQTSIGFNAELRDELDKRKDVLKEVTVEDVKKFGMIPEFVGRLPVICTMEGLSEDMLVKILKEPKNAILKQYRKLLAMDEVKLDFTDEALKAIAQKAMEKDTGARALRAIIESLMLDIMFEIPKDENIGMVTITKEYVDGTGGPVVDLRGGNLSFKERGELLEVKE